jgi:hypothetical protein
MDDPETWSDETRETLTKAAELFKRWRCSLRTATVCRPVVDLPQYDAVQATTADGRVLLAVCVPAGTDEVRLPGFEGEFQLTDEWTGDVRAVSVDSGGLCLPSRPTGDGLLVSLARS